MKIVEYEGYEEFNKYLRNGYKVVREIADTEKQYLCVIKKRD